MDKKIPKGVHCVDCKKEIKKGDQNISFWKKTGDYRCEDCTNQKLGTTEVYTRIVGYMRPVQNWNKGKATEYKDRKVFKIKK
jgi:anaerobic ribonucleoside-triphosphate reductase